MKSIEQDILRWDEEQENYIAPGLVDLQVNGIGGVDFNDLMLTSGEVLKATRYLLSRGVTTFFPTIITNSDENILTLIHNIIQACDSYPIVKETISGIHLEGPFISPIEGARGAHHSQYIKSPNWALIQRLQEVARGKIKMVTIAPEWDNACEFITKCRENNILVSMGHSLAETQQIVKAIEAGMTLSTHLGNGVPLLIRRHPNMIWDQLANDELYTMIITDGHHIPDSFIKVVTKIKGEKTIIVSDATCFAGLPAGEYESTIGGRVILESQKRMSIKGAGGLLAGAAKDLLEDVETIVNHKLATLSEAWKMASINVTDMLKKYFPDLVNEDNDKVIFKIEAGGIKVQNVIKNGKTVY